MVLQVGDGGRTGLTRGLFFLSLISIGFLLIFLDGLDGRFERIDVDDALRRIEVLQLLADGRWFDRTLDVIRMPDAYVSPWSRLVDLPYVLLTWMIEPFTGREVAAKYAFLVWPPVMFVVFGLLFSASLFRLIPSPSDGVPFWQFMTMAIIAEPVLLEFAPGRIDHHNVQLLLLPFFVYGALRSDLKGGVLAGVALAASLMVGLECLPLVAMGAVAVVLVWCVRGASMRTFTLCFLFSCAVTTLLIGYFLVGAVGLFETRCDSFSAPFAFGLTTMALVAGVVVLTLPNRVSRSVRLFALIGVGLPTGLLGVVLFSECLAGPYTMVDLVSQRYWFSRLMQEKGLYSIWMAGYWMEVIRIGFLSMVVVLTGIGLIREGGLDTSGRVIAWIIAGSALVLALVVFRYSPIAASIGTLFLPFAVHEMAHLWRGGRKGRAVLQIAGAGLICFIATGVANAISSTPPNPDVIDYMNADSCEGEDLSDLDQLSGGRILAPPGVAMAIASRMQPGISVAGIPFHRASPGLRRTYEALTSEDPQVRREALAPFDYVAVCRRALPAEGERAPLFRALAGGEDWPGMTGIGDGKSAFRLFRIEHDTLR